MCVYLWVEFVRLIYFFVVVWKLVRGQCGYGGEDAFFFLVLKLKLESVISWLH